MIYAGRLRWASICTGGGEDDCRQLVRLNETALHGFVSARGHFSEEVALKSSSSRTSFYAGAHCGAGN